MAIAQTGDLNEIIQIVLKGAPSKDEYGDLISNKEKIIYSKLFAMQRIKSADEVGEDLKSMQNQAQFVIRHRNNNEPLITSDMSLIHLLNKKKIEYQIRSVNYDTQYHNWDVIICERVIQK